MIDATPERVARHVGDCAGSLSERRARGHTMRHAGVRVQIGVLGVRAGAVGLDLGAVGRAVEGHDRCIDGRVPTAAACQGDHGKEASHGSNGHGGHRFLQLSLALILREGASSYG